jgi:hypothetical protein
MLKTTAFGTRNLFSLFCRKLPLTRTQLNVPKERTDSSSCPYWINVLSVLSWDPYVKTFGCHCCTRSDAILRAEFRRTGSSPFGCGLESLCSDVRTWGGKADRRTELQETACIYSASSKCRQFRRLQKCSISHSTWNLLQFFAKINSQ